MNVQNINTKTGIIANPTTSKSSIKFGVRLPAGFKIIIKNATGSDIFVRGDVDDTTSLSFPTSDGASASNAIGKHIMANSAEVYEASIGMTQLSIVSDKTASGLVSASIGSDL